MMRAALKQSGKRAEKVMSGAEIGQALSRIASEFLSRHGESEVPAVVGIRTRGVPLAEVIVRELERLSGIRPHLGILDITFYRDDLSLVDEQPVVQASELDFPIEGISLLLVDDVLYTGRTTRAALDSLLDYGRPSRIELAVLVDRGCRELPIQPDYVGLKLETSSDQIVRVHLPSIDDDEGVYVMRGASDERRAGGMTGDGTRS